MSGGQPFFQKVDCVKLYVANLKAGASFYRDRLGLRVLWKTDSAVGMGLRDHVTEVVIQKAGGRVVYG